MNMCKEHWDKLREAIDTRGLGKFIANNGQELIDHTARGLKGENTVVDFEPLMGSSMCIANLAMMLGGLAMMTPNEDGSMPCPVCFLQSFDYVNAAADGALAEAKDRGLMD
jgi:hypothetical protein